jgi:hypothetical protein
LLSICYRVLKFYSAEFPAICGQIRAINMNRIPNLKLTERNAVAIAQYATVAGAYTGEILERSS